MSRFSDVGNILANSPRYPLGLFAAAPDLARSKPRKGAEIAPKPVSRLDRDLTERRSQDWYGKRNNDGSVHRSWRKNRDCSGMGWDQLVKVNLCAHFFAALAVAEGARNTGGPIIKFSSIPNMMCNAGYPSCVATNAEIIGLFHALAGEPGPDGTRVVARIPDRVLGDRQLDTNAPIQPLAAQWS